MCNCSAKLDIQSPADDVFMNTSNSLERAIRLVRLACYAYVVFAGVWWLASVPELDWPARLLLDISDWPMDGSHDQLSRDARFLSAIGSGLLVAVSLLILLIVVPEFERGNEAVLRGTIIALLAWYFIDSTGCILAGVWSNAVLNTFYVLTMLIPLMLVGRAFSKARVV